VLETRVKIIRDHSKRIEDDIDAVRVRIGMERNFSTQERAEVTRLMMENPERDIDMIVKQRIISDRDGPRHLWVQNLQKMGFETSELSALVSMKPASMMSPTTLLRQSLARRKASMNTDNTMSKKEAMAFAAEEAEAQMLNSMWKVLSETAVPGDHVTSNRAGTETSALFADFDAMYSKPSKHTERDARAENAEKEGCI
jgi:hypothetical protein